MASQEISSRELEKVMEDLIYNELGPINTYDQSGNPDGIDGISVHYLYRAAEEIEKLIKARSNDNEFFFASSLNEQFKSIKPLLEELQQADAVACMKAFKVMLAVAAKRSVDVSE